MKLDKKEIQNELQNLGKEIDTLYNRRESLRAENNTILASLKSQTHFIGEGLINGVDTTQASESLARDKAKLEGLTEALRQADARYSDLDRKLKDKEKALVMIDVNQLADVAYLSILECIDRLRAVDTSLKSLSGTFVEISTVGAQVGWRIDADDHLRLLKQIHGYLLGEYDNSDGISFKLNHIEVSFADTLKKAREKKGK